VLVDFTAAFDAVRRKNLLTKLLELFSSITLHTLMNEILSNRVIQERHLVNQDAERWVTSRVSYRTNLVYLVRLLYISDLPNKISHKFIHADNITLTVQNNKFKITEEILTGDLGII